MIKKILLLLSLCMSQVAFGQITFEQKLIELGKLYKSYMFANETPKEVLQNMKTNVPDELELTTDFIAECIRSKNKLLTDQFLKRPNDAVLKQAFIVNAIYQNLREEKQVANDRLIDSLMKKEVLIYELVENYYSMIFASVGNKNQPFNLSKINFNLDNYQLKDETEKGIFFLSCMDLCGSSIWGYINIAKPANTKKALTYIRKFPKFNSLLYYQYTDLYFNDFEMVISKDDGLESYKTYHINKFYETLLSHLMCLNVEGSSQEEKNNLLLGSILREQNLYKYTKHKDLLENIFKIENKK